MIKNIIPQAKEKPKNDIEVLVKGQSCIDMLEKELAALSGPPDVAPCTAEVGTVIKCAIVNAASPSDFWCQMSGPILRLHEKMKQCTTKLGELPEVNTYCAAVLSDDDDTVYRAKVLAIADGKVTIRCIDYGTEQTLPLQKLFKLKADCADVCAQAFHVSLPLAILEDKAGEALSKLQSIATNAVNIKLYSCTDELFTVEISEQPHASFVSEGLATSTLASLEEICTSLKFPVATAEQGYFISHIDDLATFYVQQSDLDIDTLTATVHTACTTGSLPALKLPTRGSACAAKYSADGAWYRALVTDIKPDKKVQIRFIDFGNSETVSNTSLKELPPTLHEMPVAALKCCLSPLPEGYTELTELFTTVAMEKEVTLEPTESGVSVTMEGALLADVFEKATSYAKLRFTEATLGEAHNVTCPTVESPYSIWVQLAEHGESLTAIMASLAEYCPEAPTLLTCGVDTVCAALFQDDEQWYRAVVLEQTATDCNVRFIDYGNTSRVTKDKMKLLTEDHLVLPATCLRVRLGDVRPATGEQWSDPAIDKLYELTAEVECEMKLTSYRAQQHVSLSVEGVDIATQLGTAECGAKHVPDPQILTVPALDLEGVEVNVVITHVDSVDKVIVQLEDASEAVLELSAATKAAAADLVTVGDLFLPLQCWAKFSADGELYRANVDSFNKTHAEVTFIDYGNADKVPITDLWYFAPEHVTSAVQGIPVKFEGIKPVKGDSWDATATKKLTEIVMDQLGTVTFSAKQGILLGSDSLSISMTIEEKDVATQMKEARVARSAVQPPFVAEYPVQTLTEPTLAAVIEVGAKITLALDAGLEELSAKLQETCVEGHPDYVPETIEEGSVCCCKFSEDGLWYRGLVKALNGDKATVLFVDYGNSEDKKVAELQLLPAEFSTAPYCFAISLSNESELSELEMNFLPKILTDAEVTVTPTGPGSATLTKTEEGAEPTDVVELTAEYCKAVGAYPVCEPLAVDEVVYLTEVVSPAEWYVQRDGSEESLEAITTAVATSSKTVVPAPFVNQPVLGVFDGALYRALVTAVAPGKISLWFVDYGNTATVREVYEVTPSDMEWIPQAIRCSFKNAVSVSGDVFPVTAKKAVETLMLEKEILISSVYEEGCVSVIVEEQNVRMSLLSTGVLKDTAETVGQYTFIPLPEHEVEVFVSHTDHDNLFFASRTGGEKEESEDEAEEDNDVVIDSEQYVAGYQAVLEDALPPALEEVEVGSLCVVRWEEALYRATILWLDEAHAKVRFVDYGNTWICPVTSLLACPEPYRGPGLAVPLHGLINDKPVSGETLYNVLSAGAKEGLVQPVTIAIPPPKLLKFKYRKMDIGVEETLYVSAPCENGLFYCQRGEDEETLATLTEQTAALAATPTKPEHVVPGAPVLAQFVDQAWYRAVVLEPVGAGAKVWFVDYGNSETCSKLCAVTREIMQLPAIAIKCQLKDVTFVNVDALETYNTHVIDNAELTIAAHSKDDAHVHTVTALNEEGLDVSKAILELKDLERTVSLRSLPVNAAIPLYCSKFISPSELCFQCEEDTVLLDTIGAECLACPKVTLVSHNVDQLCLALYSVDKAYYRARILSVEEATCKVFFIDYGNKETVAHTALYDITQSLANHAVCGIPAAFHNSVPTAESGWSDSTIKTLGALMSPDAALTVTATEHRVDGVYPVRVSLGAVDLRQKFEGECCEQEAGLALGRPWYPLAEPLAMFVSVSVSPREFYCQRGSDEGALAALQALVDQTELTPLKTVNVGDYCVGMSLESEGLFRGQVLAIEEAVATVKFIDYGNTEDIATDTLYAMSPALYTLPVYAVHCTLEGEYDDTLSTKFVEEVCYADAEVSITPLSYTDEVCSVSLSIEGVDVKELLE